MTVQLQLPGLNSPTTDVGEPRENSPTNAVGESKHAGFFRFLNRDKSLGGKGHVEEYKPKKANNFYYRYSYRAGNRIKSRHIPGGNIYSNLAEMRADIIQQMIDRDASTPEILKMIDCFKKA